MHFAVLGLLLYALMRLPGAWRAWGWRLTTLKALVLLIGVIALPLLPGDVPEMPVPYAPPISRPEGTSAPVVVRVRSQEEAAPSAYELAVAVWAAGMLAFALRLGIRVKRASDLAQDGLPLPAHWPNSRCVPRRDQVLLSPHVDAPMVVGLLRPRVLLPISVDPPMGWEAAVAHEFAHLRRQDLRWDFVVQISACVFWFHPVAWFAVREHRMACEEASDTLAIQSSGFSSRAYALVLVGLGRSSATGLSLGAPARALRRRIHAMHRHPLSPSWLLPLLLFAVVGLVPVALTAAPSDELSPPATFDHIASGMVGQPSVRREIGLAESDLKKMSSDQAALYERSLPRIRKTMEAMKARGESSSKVVAYREREMERYYRESTAISFRYLSTPQKKRLREITLRRYGTMALASPPIARAAGVSKEKQRAIAKIRGDLHREMNLHAQAEFRRRRTLMDSGTGLPPNERTIYTKLLKKSRTEGLLTEDWNKVAVYGKRIDQINRLSESKSTVEADRLLWVRYTERANALLSPQEMAKWRKMLGRPYTPGPGEVHIY
ncbi:MAG: M56 family metallopeptidase [Fimbriimonas sp.]